MRGLCSALNNKGICVTQTAEPGGNKGATSFSGVIRDIFSCHEEKVPILSELFLLLSARIYNVEQIIFPALSQGHWVVSDRFNDSTYAYQGYGSGFDLEAIRALIRQSGCDIEPNVTFVVDISPKIALARIKDPDAIERRSYAFYKRVREGYHAIAQHSPERVFLLQGCKSPRGLLRDALQFLDVKGLMKGKA
ncbi:Thymidylate kinase [Candidatus Similichlamydia laticola]|uniref:Thymidylate kinase n=1 Tax=Candidatus Similichlamydia laticola TaxID=2170265 RepID=A0A369KI93_9BACT|nr:Thymidylate kinase [Candidatus Similichlamydia laticola]